MINENWNQLITNDHKTNNSFKNLIKNQSINLSTNLIDNQLKSPQNITLQVNGEEEEKYFINNNSINNSLKINHDNDLNQSCLSLNEFNLPTNSTQLSLDSLSSDTCIHAEAGRLFHQQLDKELNKVIPRKTSIETVQNRYKFNKKRKKNLVSNMANQVKKFDNLDNNLDFNQTNSNCPSIYEPLISNGFKNNQYEQTNLLNPNSANKFMKESNSVQSIFLASTTNNLKPPCSKTTSIGNFINKTNTPITNLSNLNLKTDLTPTNLRRRCIAKNGNANIRNAKISRKSQKFFLDFFNTMIDIEWHYNLLVFALSFVISWLFFAVIWWSIAYQHGDLYRIEELDNVSVDLDKMNMNLNFLTDNINTADNVLSKSKRSIAFNDEDKILNKLALTILNNRTTIQQLIEHFNLSKLRLNSTSGTNIHHQMEDGKNITHFLSYAKNNPNLKETFASHNVSLNKIAKLVQSKRIYLNDSNQRSINEQNDIKLINNIDTLTNNQEQTNQQIDQQKDKQQSLLMNTVQTMNQEEHLPQFPVTNLTIDQRHQLENLFYLMQLQYLLQQERNKQQIAKFLTKLAKKAHQNSIQNKPAHPLAHPPAHPLPDTSMSQAIEEQEEKIQKEILDAKHKEQEKKERQRLKLEKQEKQKLLLNDILNSNSNNLAKPDQPIESNQNKTINNSVDKDSLDNLKNLQNLQEQLINDQSNLPSTDEVIEEAVLKASQSVLPKCGLNGTESCRKVCLDNVNSFGDALLFSIETQHTIGFGTRNPRDCKVVLVVLIIQTIFGCLIQSFVVGFVFAKLSRPQNRHKTLVFSKKAVINLSEHDKANDFTADAHLNNQFNLNFEELNDLVNLMKSGEMLQECGYTNSETSSADQQNRRQSSDAISTDDDLLLQQQHQQNQINNLHESYLNPFNQFKDQNLLNLNLLNIPSSNLNSKRNSNVSFLTGGLSTQSKISNNPNLNICCDLEHNFDYTDNKNYKLQFRVGDVREKSHIINAKIQAYFLSKDNYCLKNDILPKQSNRFKYQLFKKRKSDVDFSNLNLKLNASNLNTNKIYNYNELIMEKKLHNFSQKKLHLTIDNVEHSDGELLLIWPIVVSQLRK